MHTTICSITNNIITMIIFLDVVMDASARKRAQADAGALARTHARRRTQAHAYAPRMPSYS